MVHNTDSERPALLDMQKLRFDQLWRKGEILDATYLRSLFIIGYLPDEANTELNLLKMERSDAVARDVLLSCDRHGRAS